MIIKPMTSLAAWLTFFSQADIPVLRLTSRRLLDFHKNIDEVSVKSLSALVQQDPLLSLKVWLLLASRKSSSFQKEITTLQNALTMIGVRSFFERFAKATTPDMFLRHDPEAQVALLKKMRTAQRTAVYAGIFATERHDIDVEEVVVAALLYNFHELLLGSFAPTLMAKLPDLDHETRAEQEKEVIGVHLPELKAMLMEKWACPPLLKMADRQEHEKSPRVQTILLAARIARRSEENWDNVLLEEDLQAASTLLHMDMALLLPKLNLPSDRIGYFLGVSRKFLLSDAPEMDIMPEEMRQIEEGFSKRAALENELPVK